MKFFNNGCLKPDLPEELNNEAGHAWCPIFPQRPQPPQRSTHATCVYQRKLFLYGGRGKYGALNDFWTFDLDKEIWEEVKVEGDNPGRLQGHSMLSYGGCIYIFGGKICSSAHEITLWQYDIDLNKWTHVLSESNVKWPSTRRLHSAVVYENAMYIYGGFQEITGPTNELWLYDFNSCSWHLDSYASDGNNNFPSPRYEHTALVHSDNMWLCGGMTGLTSSAEVWSWHFNDRTWTQWRSRNGPYELSGHSAAVVGWNMYILGGNDRSGEVNQNMWRFSLWKHNWKKCSFSNFIKPELVTGQSMVTFVDFTNGNTSFKNRAQSMPTLKSVKASQKVTSASTRSLQLGRRSNAVHDDNLGKLFYKRNNNLARNFDSRSSLISNEIHCDDELYYDHPVEVVDLDWEDPPQSEAETTGSNEAESDQPENRGAPPPTLLPDMKGEGVDNAVLKSFISSCQQVQVPSNKTIPLKQMNANEKVSENFKRFSYNLMKESSPTNYSIPFRQEAETSFIILPTMHGNDANPRIILEAEHYNKEAIIQKKNVDQSKTINIARNSHCTEAEVTLKPVLLKKKLSNATSPKRFEIDFDISLLVIGGKPIDSLSSVCIDRPVKLWKCQNCKCDD